MLAAAKTVAFKVIDISAKIDRFSNSEKILDLSSVHVRYDVQVSAVEWPKIRTKNECCRYRER
jgi:hypothetical protein